jgi:hypothetical protein
MLTGPKEEKEEEEEHSDLQCKPKGGLLFRGQLCISV